MTAVAMPTTEQVVKYAGEDWKFETDRVDVDTCYADRFQRPLNERWLKQRIDEFWPPLLGTITCSWREKRSKTHSVVDGQHRVELTKRWAQKNGVEVPLMNAVVFVELSIQQEAKLFSLLQRERRGITPYQRFQADLVAMEPKQVAIAKIVKDVGLEFDETKDEPGYIKCVVACERVYEADPAMLRTVLGLIQRTWPTLPGARSERMVRGIHMFVADEQDFDPERFVDRLSAVAPSTLHQRAQQLKDGEDSNDTLPEFFKRAISNSYRSKKRAR